MRIKSAEPLLQCQLPPQAIPPLVLMPDLSDEDLATTIADRKIELESLLHKHGALLFRGYPIATAQDYDRAIGALIPTLMVDNGEHQPIAESDKVYKPVKYEESKKLLWHNENSFNALWPLVIAFCCIRPADVGGDTPVADSREVLKALPPALADAFRRRGVTYTRTYGFGLGRSWQEVFRTDSRAVLEARLQAEGYRWEWRGEDALITHQARPAVVRHPDTGEESFFAQPTHWHPYCLDAETREALLSIYAEDELPRNCFYGDGGLIEDADMQAVIDAYDRVEITLPWQAGDIIVLDNVLYAHARNPYQGRRELLVAMGHNCTFAEGAMTRRLTA